MTPGPTSPQRAGRSTWWKNGCLIVIALPLVIMVSIAWYNQRTDREEQQRQVEAYERQQEETRSLRAEMQRRCDELVAMVKREPTSASGLTSTLEDRLVQRRLLADDFKLKAADLPCSDTMAQREVIWKGFVAAAVNSLDAKNLAWMTEELFEAVEATKLTEERSEALTKQIEEHVGERLKDKEVSSFDEVLLVCERAAALTGADPGPQCKTAARRQKLVERRLKTETQQEEARQKRERAAEAARERAAGACAERCDRSYPDMGPRWDVCNNKCLGLDEPLF